MDFAVLLALTCHFFVASITSTTGLFCPFLQTSVYFLNFDMLRELIYFLKFHGSIDPTKISNRADFFFFLEHV